MNRLLPPLSGIVLCGLLFQLAGHRGACPRPEPWTDPPALPEIVFERALPEGAEGPRDLRDLRDPFDLGTPAPRRPQASRPPVAPVDLPHRPWTITGLVGTRAAVLRLSSGASVVVTVGQEIDGATVVGISGAGVELEDRGGRFVLKAP